MKQAFFCLPTCFILLACQAPPPAPDVVVPTLFSNHMVLQRDANIKIWGKATPNSQVEVNFKNQHAEVVSAADSSWLITLAPEPAGGPFELEIRGENAILLSDVLVGEVWIASGQSNMQWTVQASNNAEEEIAGATDDQIRLLSVQRTMAGEPANHLPSDGWHVNSPETIPDFSAVAYYFGRVLRDSLDVPIGLINSSWGGTRAEAWTSGTSLIEHPDYAESVQTLQSNPEDFRTGVSQEKWLAKIQEKDLGMKDSTALWAAPDLDDSAWQTMNLPQLWEEAGLPNYDGLVWFRKTVKLPAGWQGKDLILELAKIDDIDETWVNGNKIGATYQYNQDRKYTVSSSLLKPDGNTITVRVLDTGGGGGIYGEAANMRLAPVNQETDALSLAGDWRYKEAIDLKDKSIPPRPAGQQHTPTVLYNAMIHPLIPYTVKGVIWYQGESNASRAHQYQTLFPMLIQDWRTRWDRMLSFHFVQLANFMKQQVNPVEKETWPELREAQMMALDLIDTGMAVIIDIGEAEDIHPRNKQDVGFRLALSALHESYEHDTVPAGPLYKSFSTEDQQIRIQFDYAENGLKMGGPHGPANEVTGFAIAGEDKVFHRAEARIDMNEVVVSSPLVQSPVAVRYGWANNPVVNLYNVEGLPASPFRTDDWPGITVGAK